jgi:hypothetical protein
MDPIISMDSSTSSNGLAAMLHTAVSVIRLSAAAAGFKPDVAMVSGPTAFLKLFTKVITTTKYDGTEHYAGASESAGAHAGYYGRNAVQEHQDIINGYCSTVCGVQKRELLPCLQKTG